MYLRVDEVVEDIRGYSYKTREGLEEYVTLNYNDCIPTVSITDSSGDCVIIYKEDISNLIKALQAAYDHKGK